MNKNENKKYLKDVYANSEARDIFGLTTSGWLKNIESTELFDSVEFRKLSSTDEVLYGVFETPIKFQGRIYYLFKIELKENKFTFCGLHRMCNDEKLNKKYARESVMINYIYSHDRNISANIGNFEYI